MNFKRLNARRYLTFEEAAKYLEITKKEFRDLIRDGKIPRPVMKSRWDRIELDLLQQEKSHDQQNKKTNPKDAVE